MSAPVYNFSPLYTQKDVIEDSVESARVHETSLISFKKYLADLLLKLGKLSPDNVELILDIDNLEIFLQAFTHWSYDPENNYEYYETVGDTLVNSFSVIFYNSNFPIAENPDKVYLMTKLKTKYISKQEFSKFSDLIGFPSFIRYKELRYIEVKKEKQIILDNSMKEDVFEAFFGALIYVVDKVFEEKIGINVCLDVFTNFLYSIDILNSISLRPEDLESNRGKIKEVFDALDKNCKSVGIHDKNKYELEEVKEQVSQVSQKPEEYKRKWRLNIEIYPKSYGYKKVNKSFVGEGALKDTVNEQLSKEALDYLKQAFGIEWTRQNKKTTIIIP